MNFFRKFFFSTNNKAKIIRRKEICFLNGDNQKEVEYKVKIESKKKKKRK